MTIKEVMEAQKAGVTLLYSDRQDWAGGAPYNSAEVRVVSDKRYSRRYGWFEENDRGPYVMVERVPPRHGPLVPTYVKAKELHGPTYAEAHAEQEAENRRRSAFADERAREYRDRQSHSEGVACRAERRGLNVTWNHNESVSVPTGDLERLLDSLDAELQKVRLAVTELESVDVYDDAQTTYRHVEKALAILNQEAAS